MKRKHVDLACFFKKGLDGFIVASCHEKFLSHEKKKTALLSIESWLVNRDPYFMVYEIIPEYSWVVFHPPYVPWSKLPLNWGWETSHL